VRASELSHRLNRRRLRSAFARGLRPVAATWGEMRRGKGRPLPMFLNSMSLILAKVFSLGLGFLAWLVAARLFEPTVVGLASATVAAMMLCVQFSLVGVGSSIINLFPARQHAPARLFDTAFSVVGFAAIAAGAVFLILAATILRELRVVAADPAFAVVFVLLGVFGALGVLLDQISTVVRRGDEALRRNILAGIVTLVAVVGIALGRFGSPSLGILIAWAIGSVAAVALGWRQLAAAPIRYRFRPDVDRSLARRLIGLGFPNYLLTLAERAPGPVLPIVVTELLSPAANAHWYAVWMVAWVVFIVPIQVGLSLFAEVSHRPESLAEIVRHGIRSSLAIGILGAVGVTIGAELVLQLLGHGYAAAGAAPLRILVWAVVPATFIQAYFSTCRATQRLREAIGTAVASGVVGVTAAAIGGLTAGLTGMAVAWLVSQVLTAVWAISRLRVLMTTSGPDVEGTHAAPRAQAQI
jgi:O-antigen/teichoic acid export membrane protein